MNKIKNIIWIITIGLLCVISIVLYNTYKKSESNIEQITSVNSETMNDTNIFSDGLTDPDSVTRYELNDFDIGVSEKSIFYADINNDGKKDRIIRTFTETGNAHAYYEYILELNIDGAFVDITPDNFRTINGADCDLQQIQFVFKPTFKVILISRDLGKTWDSETMAKKQVFKISDNKLKPGAIQNLRPVCDVKELF